ncbi:MAG: F0F1 ATP synthase subunit gamma [Alphaproteobacteria bacterium]|nr:F0F1 ATP synthase subunit gamma [Alphaproteobacteria bacterium]
MPSLKDLKLRINSVKSTQKITSAMKMVAAAKLRRAQEHAEAGRPYAERMEHILANLGAKAQKDTAPKLLVGSGLDTTHLLVVMTSDRGLCGGFNSSIIKITRKHIHDLQSQGKKVKILCVGRKGRDQLRRDFGSLIIDTIEDVAKPKLTFEVAEKLAYKIKKAFEAHEFDVCTLIYNKFKSVISQIVTLQQLIPFISSDTLKISSKETESSDAQIYDYEPDEDQVLETLLPLNLAVQLFRGLLESGASEQGARMSAMDNATRNAGDMINRLTIHYNRTRQAYITKELIEIISGAEAV